MTSTLLVLLVVAGVFLQLLLWLGWVYWKQWRKFRTLSDEVMAPTTQPVSWAGFRTLRVIDTCHEDEAKTIRSFHLVFDDGSPLPAFLPGQYLTIRTQAGTRCYSLSDAPGSSAYRISVKRALAPMGSSFPAGRVSAALHERIQVGDTIEARAPSGYFTLLSGDDSLVLIAGGIGITPLMSMLNWCAREQPHRDIWLFYGVRHGGEVFDREHLVELTKRLPNFHLLICCNEPSLSDRQGVDYHRVGIIDLPFLRATLPLRRYQFYVCGPGAMTESIVSGLVQWGVSESQIHYETFGPSSIRRPSADTASDLKLTFAKSGKTIAWDPAAGSLLEIAEANGIRVESGCRAGSCGSCETAIESGEVAYLTEPHFDPKPGSCLLCCSVPKTDLILSA